MQGCIRRVAKPASLWRRCDSFAHLRGRSRVRRKNRLRVKVIRRQTTYVLNNRKEVIQCLIVLRRSFVAGSSPPLRWAFPERSRCGKDNGGAVSRQPLFVLLKYPVPPFSAAMFLRAGSRSAAAR